MLTTGSAERFGLYKTVDGVAFDMPGELARQQSPEHIIVIDDFLPLEVIEMMRKELEQNMHNAVLERDHDQHGDIKDRYKLFEPLYGKYVTIQILCSGALQELAKNINDYVYRMYACGFTKDYEWAYGRYEKGGGYRWHADHPPMREYFRYLNFSLFLTENCGGALEINSSVSSIDWERKGKVDVAVEFTVEPKIGRFVMMPCYYLHRVAPSTSQREVLFGHVNMVHNYDYDAAYGS